jgi:hypothetical protein
MTPDPSEPSAKSGFRIIAVAVAVAVLIAAVVAVVNLWPASAEDRRATAVDVCKTAVDQRAPPATGNSGKSRRFRSTAMIRSS